MFSGNVLKFGSHAHYFLPSALILFDLNFFLANLLRDIVDLIHLIVPSNPFSFYRQT